MDLKVCRICGGVKELKNILDQGTEMMDKLLVCANINVQNPEDLLPKLICEECDKHLDLSYRLRKQSEATQKRLRREIKRKQNEKAGAGSRDNELKFSSEKLLNVYSKQSNEDISNCRKFFQYQQSEECFERKATRESFIDEQKPLSQKQDNNVGFNKVTEIAIQKAKNLEQQLITTEILIDDDEDNDEISHRSHSDFIMHTSEDNDKEKLQEATKVPIFSKFCSIDLLSSSSRSSTNDCCVDFQNDLVRAQCGGVHFLTCGTCNEVFTTKKEYSTHIKQHGQERYQCIQCCKFFSTRFRLKRHEEIHNEIPSYQCSYCKRSYRALYNLNRHVRSAHLGKKSWGCDVCNVSFSRVDVLKRHLQLHSDEKKYKCLLCEQSFKTRDYLYAHNKTYHTPNTGTSKTSKRTKSDNSNKNQCGYCGKLFKSSFAYKNHLLIHTNEKPYECESCLKKFRTIAALTIHQRVHDDYRPYQCDLCLKSFRQTFHLKEHKLLHSNNVPQHICSICQASFAKKSNLKAHMRLHNQEKPFKCADCFAEFSYMHLLQRHASKIHNRSVHKVYTTNDTDETPEPDDSVSSSGVLESELYHYIDTVADDDDDDDNNLYHNDADLVDLLDDYQEIHPPSPELEIVNDELAIEQQIFDNENNIRIESAPIKDYIAIHSLNLIQLQSNDEDLVENIIDDESHIIEQKVDLFVSEDTKLTSCVYNISKLQ